MYILPIPKEMTTKKEKFYLDYKSRVVMDFKLSGKEYGYAKLINNDIKKYLGYSLSITKGIPYPKDIVLRLDLEIAEEEGYTILITEENVVITGKTSVGLLHGVQTFRQMIKQLGGAVTCGYIHDYPTIANRGFYHDVTRGRIPTLKTLKQLADRLSYYKVNQLQLYVEHSFLFRDFSEVWRDDTPLTAEEILELDYYCIELNIELVPSLSTFGHLYKILESKTFGHLREIQESTSSIFSFDDRMAHHTLAITKEESFELSKKMILEFIPLFSSKHFNICADETFDLGKGHSQTMAEKIGTHQMYIDYVAKLCDIVIAQNKVPMFWGDVIVSKPDAIYALPKEVICLNWGYSPHEKDYSTKAFSEAGVNQYLCPGVGGWNQFINLLESSYNNITKMCEYAKLYKALGILNTDWGDYGHVNHPEFSAMGLIYGAIYSWGDEKISFHDINKQISALEYGDSTGAFVSLIAKASTQMVFEWSAVIRYKERGNKEFISQENLIKADECNERLVSVKEELLRLASYISEDKKYVIKPYLLGMEAMIVFNHILQKLIEVEMDANHNKNKSKTEDEIGVKINKSGAELAVDLEYWFYDYKNEWRLISKESELYRLQEVVNWYGDLLREIV